MAILSIGKTVLGEGIPKIIVPLMGNTTEQLVQEVNEVKRVKPDIVEWRVDVYEHVDQIEAVQAMISTLRKVLSDELLLFTFRSHKEGGNKEVPVSYYVELLQAAIMTKKIDLVDVELFTGEKYVKELVETAEANGVYVIMSNHDFEKTPSKQEILTRLCKMQELGAHIPKIAVMPNGVEDVITLLEATNTMKTNYADRPIITISMGGKGLISRLAGECFGSAATFGAGNQESAPGQIPVPELRRALGTLHKFR
ncbi:type I 3-dehydroquinate dehydratase [Niallia endozanthoxylica]|uniref:3-dehydroquinate dehydratase n=1 Tax=Niallia endozanthoxylica TaxID=2036016 RepID=A0A5J5I2M2_9BACI|nr:type I 3-dehydroquinate dehydratase [Niallia endozanthoxylica]KAA9029911.1 type I 3-dehydroquinate dehydratase [Niallia endozanthoxylica]